MPLPIEHPSTPEVTPLELLNDCKYLKAYEQVFSHEHATALSRLIPSYMHGGIVRYILIGTFPGSFLSAYLDGNLFDAITYADDTNKKLFHEYAMFLWNYAPASCYGDPKSVQRWAERGGQLGPEDRAT